MKWVGGMSVAAPPPPLAGQRVVITRAADQTSELATLLTEAGADVLLRPTIAILRVEGAELARVDRALSDLSGGHYDALALTSPRAAELTFSRLAELGLAAGELPRLSPKIAVWVVGGATAAVVERAGVAVGHVASEASSEGLARELLTRRSLRSARVLFLRAREGRDTLATALERAGAVVDLVPLYETKTIATSEPLPAEGVTWLTFTSPSTVRGFVAHHMLPRGARVACLGEVTAAAAREAGLAVDAVASNATMASLVEAMTRAGDAQRER